MRTLRPDAVTGSIPEDLRGSLFRVGPGRCRVGDAKYAHWFDGDGAVFACSFESDKNKNNTKEKGVTIRAGIKFVRTSRFTAQERFGVDKGVAVRGAWTQADERNFPFANLFRFPTNPSNTAPLVHSGELLALCEGGAPVRIDKRTLATLDDPGTKNEKKSVFKESAGRRLPMGFSAHAKKDGDGSLYTWGLAAPPAIGVQVARISATGEVTHVVDLPLCAGDLDGRIGTKRALPGATRVYAHPRLRDVTRAPGVCGSPLAP
jgi:carotenoid cleavage dioxygenase-like enzyme